ncbi:beta-propeller fold lactonase family protein [Trinickia fusca]|nr:beta-propeller fold lactonase family protein [Trinickia fusca]
MALFPDQTTLAVAAETAGLALINVQDAIAGNATPVYVQQGASVSASGNGSIDVAVSNDNKYVFVANEYGKIGNATTTGNLGVVSIQEDSTGHASGALMGNISTGQSTIPGLTLSPDGATLYVANEESFKSTVAQLAGYSNPETGFACSLTTSSTTYSGSVSVIDVAQAEAQPDGSAIISTVAAGCETVRVAVSPDNKTVWATARSSNAIYAFDATKLRSDPNNAFISVAYSGGTEPVGIAMFPSGKYVAVSNSNRSQASNLGSNGLPLQGVQNVTIFDISTPSNPLAVQTVKSGIFPRSLSISPDGTTLLIPNFDSNTLEIAPVTQ